MKYEGTLMLKNGGCIDDVIHILLNNDYQITLKSDKDYIFISYYKEVDK